MGTYGLQTIVEFWELEKLTPEQAIGQLLQLMIELDERLSELEKRVRINERKARRASGGNSRGRRN